MAQKSGGDKVTRNIVIAMVTLVVAVGVIFSVMGNKASNSVSLPSQANSTNGNGIEFNGDLTGVPVVDIWEDFQCPACAQFEALNSTYIESIIKEKRARVIFHPLSFIGPESIRAANAAACAADEGKYIDFHKALYRVQSPLENSGFWSNETLVAIGGKVGITSEKFTKCVTDGQKVELVKANYDSMAKYGVQGTPTVFIDGKLWERKSSDFNADEFRAAVEGN